MLVWKVGGLPLRASESIQRFSLISTGVFCHPEEIKRLLIEILVIAALIYFAWDTPFKNRVARAEAKITSVLDEMGGSLQKNQDESVRRY